MKFKEGDKVICINSEGYNLLTLNKQYTVDQYNILYKVDDIIYLKEFDRDRFYAHRFKLDKKYYRKQKLKQLRNEI